MPKEVKKQIYELLNCDNSGHRYNHIERVLTLTLKFTNKENASKLVVILITLLHFDRNIYPIEDMLFQNTHKEY